VAKVVRELGALLHRGEQVTRAQQQLLDLFRDLLAEVAASGNLRDDVAPDELASYCPRAANRETSPFWDGNIGDWSCRSATGTVSPPIGG